MKKAILLLTVMITFVASAQDETVKALRDSSGKTIKKDPNDTLPKIWKTGGLYSLSISQGSQSNWAAGGDDFSISLNSLLSIFAFYKKERHSWDNTLDFNLAFVKTTSQGTRKNDDRIDILSKYGYALNSKLNLAGLFNFRSQFFKGYSYDGDGAKTFVSTFLAPGYIIFSPGLDFKPNENLSIFVSPITIRWTIVKDDSLSAQGSYGVDPGKNSNSEYGAFASVNYIKAFNKNITYKGRLDLFSNYEHNPQNVDLYFTNLLSIKLSEVFAITWSVDMIYDDDVRLFGDFNNGAALQLKSQVGIGVLAKF